MLAAGVSVAIHGALVLQLPADLTIPESGDSEGVQLALSIQPTKPHTPPPTPPANTPNNPPTAANTTTATPVSPAVQQRHATAAPPSTASTPSQSPATPGSAAPTRTDYLGTLQRWLARHQHYPTAASERGWQGVVELAFVIDRNGQVSDPRVASSSGHAVLDRAALDMLARAAPLPPVPPQMAQDTLRLRVPISFNLWGARQP